MILLLYILTPTFHFQLAKTTPDLRCRKEGTDRGRQGGLSPRDRLSGKAKSSEERYQADHIISLLPCDLAHTTYAATLSSSPKGYEKEVIFDRTSICFEQAAAIDFCTGKQFELQTLMLWLRTTQSHDGAAPKFQGRRRADATGRPMTYP
jgi:hypothetical protein